MKPVIFITQLISRLKSLTRLERARVELTLARIQNIPPIMFVFNLFLLGISMLARIKAQVMGILANFGLFRSDLYRHQPLLIPGGLPPATVPVNPVVLLVVEDTIAQCFHYRVEQKMQQLQILGLRARWVSWRELEKARHELHFAHIVIFYRVPAFQGVLETIKYARALNKITIYDIDDLVFDRAQLEMKFTGATGQLPAHERNSMLRGAELYQSAIRECAFAIASTEVLRTRLTSLIGDKRCFVLHNGIGEPALGILAVPPAPKPNEYCDIFYGSGTKTHDEDFALVAKSLGHLMQQYANVRLILVGYLSLPTQLEPFRNRIHKLPPLEFETFLSVLCLADINIAPLESGLFADCKSEIKWLEAAMLGVPSVVSRTATYQKVITDGTTGFLAENESEWSRGLEALVKDPSMRKSIGSSARREARKKYGPEILAGRLNEILQATMIESEQEGAVSTNAQKIHLMFVNTLYPPQALGGATSVLVNIVRQLRKVHADRYRVSVVTYDMMRPVPYQIRQYAWEGIEVTAISAPPGPEMDWTYKDERIRDVFERLLDFQQPHLVHFHSVQRLTGSVLEACERMGIPFVVTVHDAWWLSDHQFLLDKNGAPVPDLQRNPIVAARSSAHIPGTLKRGRYLATRLGSAERIFAVSDYQADLYRRNGFDHVWLNRNGVDMASRIDRPDRPGTKLQLGYAGGICVHKGYFFLKSAISSLDLPNLGLTVIDFELRNGQTNRESWGSVDVTFIPPFPYDDRARFYDSIHVLIAPSLWPESFGLITREASLHGIWVVASDAGGLAEDISPGENGHTFDVGNEPGLKKILIELENNRARYMVPPPTTERTSAIANVAKQVDELEAHYQTVLGNLGARRRGESPAYGTSR